MKEHRSLETKKPNEYVEDPLTNVLRPGARDLLAQVVEGEVTVFLATHADIRDNQGRQMIVLNGHLPARTIQTSTGAVPVRAQRVRDRRAVPKADHVGFTSKILPRYLWRNKSLEELIPRL